MKGTKVLTLGAGRYLYACRVSSRKLARGEVGGVTIIKMMGVVSEF